MLRFIAITLLMVTVLTGCQLNPASDRRLSDFQSNATPQQCYNRNTQPHTFVVDSHIHFRPYGNNALDYQTLTRYFAKTGVLFANVYGIGQTLPQDGDCLYPANCPTTPVRPTIDNDIINIENAERHPNPNVHLIHAMTFADLNQPNTILPQIEKLQTSYNNQFKWMGEINLVKQGLFANGHKAANVNKIEQWRPFMDYLQQHDIPLALHADIGNNIDPQVYLPIFDKVLTSFPANKIVWLHMGISPEQTKLSAEQHLKILQTRLDQSPNLYIDISWKILNKQYNKSTNSKQQYVDFFNRNYHKILTGSDFVATDKKKLIDYKNSVRNNSDILKFIDNRAFKYIVLGQNYFDLLQLNYQAPPICKISI